MWGGQDEPSRERRGRSAGIFDTATTGSEAGESLATQGRNTPYVITAGIRSPEISRDHKAIMLECIVIVCLSHSNYTIQTTPFKNSVYFSVSMEATADRYLAVYHTPGESVCALELGGVWVNGLDLFPTNPSRTHHRKKRSIRPRMDSKHPDRPWDRGHRRGVPGTLSRTTLK